MNPFELSNATDPGQPPLLAPWRDTRFPVSGPPPSSRHAAAVPVRRARALHIAIAGLLALELLPLGFLLWSGLHGDAEPYPYNDGLPGTFLVIAHSLFVAVLTTAGTLAFGLLAACQLARLQSPASRWLWRGYLGLLLLPTVANVVPLVPLLTGMGLRDNLWGLVFLGIAGGQAVAVCILRQAIDAIPRSLFHAAEIDCLHPWQQIRHVVLPACAPTLGVLAVLSFVGSWNEFLMPILLLTQDHVTVGMALANLAYDLAGGSPSTGMGTYLMFSLPVIFLGMWALRTFVRALTQPFARR